MLISAWGLTDVGLKRSNNQDSILLDSANHLYVVADGMGGHKGGEVASQMAVEVAQTILKRDIGIADLSPRDLIAKIYQEATAQIHHRSSVVSPELSGMGTTMVMAFLYNGKVYVGNVGDSRAYLLHRGSLWPMTDDHSLVNEQLRSGLIREEDLSTISGKNVITRSVGFEPEVVPDIFEREVQEGEAILLCSDGLCGLVNDQKIEEICNSNLGKRVVEKCIDEAKLAGGDDNVSVIYIQLG